MGSKGVNTTALYNELDKAAKNAEYEKALKTCNKILQADHNDETALHAKVTSLIYLSRFQDTLDLLDRSGKISVSLDFEKAYCLYRLNKISDALSLLENSTNKSSVKMKELKAQILYRMENYEECFHIYKDIMKNTSDEYDEERETNLAAVIANLSQNKKDLSFPKLSLNTYESVYNSGCKLLFKDCAGALNKLKEAEKLCRKMMEEDEATEEEIDNELGIIKVQQAYCLQKMGKEKEAMVLYGNVLKSRPDDIGLVAVASNNIVSINRDQSLFDSKKKIKSATVEELEHKLSYYQRKLIALNQCLICYYSNQTEQCKSLAKQMIKNHPSLAVEGSLILVVQLLKEKKFDEAKDLLKSTSGINESGGIILKLALVQLLLNNNKLPEACEVLQNLGSYSFKPGIVSTLVTLYSHLNEKENCSKIFKKALDYYKSNEASNVDLGTFWRQSADFYLRKKEPEMAAKSLEELLKRDPSDIKTSAQLIMAYAEFNPAKAVSISNNLPPISKLTESIDVDVIETTSWALSSKYFKKGKLDTAPTSPKTGTGDELVIKKKRKTKKKKILPKNYDPNVDPDPERWLPKWQRTGFRKRKDKRNKDIGKGTQGAASGQSDLYDISKTAQSTTPKSTVQSPTTESRQPKGIQKKKHKKKK